MVESRRLTAIWWRHEYHISGKPCKNSISGFCFAALDRPPTTRCNLHQARHISQSKTAAYILTETRVGERSRASKVYQ